MRRAYRERRRIIMLLLLFYAALKLAQGPEGPFGTPPWLGALGLALGFGLLAILAPRLRSFTETIAAACLGYAALDRLFHGSAIDLAGPEPKAMVVVAFWLGFVALARLLRRAMTTLPLPRLRHPRFKTRAESWVDIYRLWYGLVPTPGQAARYGDPDLVAIEEMSLRLGRVRLVTQHGAADPQEAHLQILEVEAPFRIRLRASAEDGRGVIRATGVSEIHLVDLGRRRLVLFSHEFPDMGLGQAFLAWLDDRPGRMLDRRLAMVERNARFEDQGLQMPDLPKETIAPAAGTDGFSAEIAPPPTGATLAAWDADSARDGGMLRPDGLPQSADHRRQGGDRRAS